MRLEDLTIGRKITGIVPGKPVTVIGVERTGDGGPVLVTYRDATGATGERYLFPDDESRLAEVEEGPRWIFDAEGAEFRLVSEALRIRYAHLFDPYLAVSSSLVEPLPHQILAVYDSMLPRQPLRFLLADDPGAGKTIMAGLLMRELQARAVLDRCLVVCPGSLAGQWQNELFEKFHLSFDIVTPQQMETTPGGNPFDRSRYAICRLDQLSRNEEFQRLLEGPELPWDLIVVDEAHKMSAHWYGTKLEKTKRYQLGERLRGVARNLLLMTATPHNGKDEDFEAFMALLDPDRFEGKYRHERHRRDYHDLMLRRIKEELTWPDGRPLFPERLAYTVAYELSPQEQELYEKVTRYVREGMNRAEAVLDPKRKNVVGFALTILQRRLASSPQAIRRSLERRRDRLARRLDEIDQLTREVPVWQKDLETIATRIADLDLDDDLPENEEEELEEQVLDAATAARTREELQVEIDDLDDLVELAQKTVAAGTDAKWSQLCDLLQDRDKMFDSGGHRRKLIVFTEHRDTLDYLAERIRSVLGRTEAVVTIRGGMGREERRRIQETFLQDPEVQILVATDAAGEGVNLQRAHLMVNYDLPWNPNRLEQRFGRIHRIGQEEVCHCWNLVAKNTREGDVYLKLFKKLEVERETLDGKVFDVLGQAFADTPLRDLMIQAIRYGDDPAREAEIDRTIDRLADPEYLAGLREGILAHDVLGTQDVQRIRDDLERAAARRLQPHHVQSFFLEAFRRLGGRIHERETARFQITRVPGSLRRRGAERQGLPIHLLNRYERVTCRKELVSVRGKPGADLLAPGHPLLDLTVEELLDSTGTTLERGAVLVDDTDGGTEPRVLVYLQHDVLDGRGAIVSRRLHFTELREDGSARDAGPAPYLDYRPPSDEEIALLRPHLDTLGWISGDHESRAVAHAATHLIRPHLDEVRRLVEDRAERTAAAVRERLTAEIAHWDRRAQELRRQADEGRQPAMNWERAQERAAELEERLKNRLQELDQERNLSAGRPVVRGAALIVPRGLLERLGEPGELPRPDTFAREREAVERLAIDAVLAAERAAGREPREMEHTNPGYDVESRDPATGRLLLIEVKGRVAGATTVTLTRTEILTGLNRPDSWFLAVVEVKDGRASEPRYVRHITDREPGFAETSVTFDLKRLLRDAVGASEILGGERQ